MSTIPAPEASVAPATYRLPLEREETPVDNAPSVGELDAPFLWENIFWFQRLRWVVIGVLAAAGLAGFFPGLLALVGLAISPIWPLACAAALTAANLIYRAATPARRSMLSPRQLHQLLWIQVVVDLIVLTVVVHFVGAFTSYAPFMYLFHIILACIFFDRLESMALLFVAALCYLACVTLEATGVLASTSVFASGAEQLHTRLSSATQAWRIGSALAIWGIIWYLASRMAGRIRRQEQDLARTNFRLEASVDERMRHMLQTTHQLKAPFAAIHANTQLLTGGYCGELPPKALEVSAKIAARCGMISCQIVEMLQLANLRSQGQTELCRHEVDLAALVQSVIDRLEPTANSRDVHFEADLAPAPIQIAEDHLRMLADNLLSNAVNYSRDRGAVHVRCGPLANGGAELIVRDEGIGIAADKLPRIFEDYFRTQEAAQHNRASTGLGLAIVRDVASAAGIHLEVSSAPGWGTQFTARFPQVTVS